MNKNIVIFDLDDTLYPEISFVESGFNTVARYIKNKFDIVDSKEKILEQMLLILFLQGRGKVFDTFLSKHGLFTKSNAKKCLNIYRTHYPNINLPKETENCLISLKKYPLYIVTDGNLVVQRNKIKALGVDKYVNKSIPTYQYGKNASKPSPYCFDLIRNWEQVEYPQMVYIGDNPNKDFVGIKPIGMKTIRINQGMFKDLKLSKKFEADTIIDSIHEINLDFLQNIFEK